MVILKKIFINFSIVGLSYFFSIFFSYLLINRAVDPHIISKIGSIEYLIIICVGIINFAVVPNAIRLIVSDQANFKHIVKMTQDSRFTLGLIIFTLLLLSSFYFGIEFFYTSLLLIILSISIDYTLYPLGKNIFSAIINFIRNGMSYIFLILILLYFNEEVLSASVFPMFIIFSLISFFATSYNLKFFYFPKNKFRFLKLYFDQYQLGLGNFFLENSRPIFFLIGIKILNLDELIIFYGLSKIYIFFLGVRRLLVSNLIKYFSNIKFSNYFDFFIFSISIFFVTIVFFQTNKISLFIFGNINENSLISIKIISLTILFASFFLSSAPRIQILKLDNSFFIINFINFTLLLILFFFIFIYKLGLIYILLSLMLFELSSSIALKIRLIFIKNDKQY